MNNTQFPNTLQDMLATVWPSFWVKVYEYAIEIYLSSFVYLYVYLLWGPVIHFWRRHNCLTGEGNAESHVCTAGPIIDLSVSKHFPSLQSWFLFSSVVKTLWDFHVMTDNEVTCQVLFFIFQLDIILLNHLSGDLVLAGHSSFSLTVKDHFLNIRIYCHLTF